MSLVGFRQWLDGRGMHVIRRTPTPTPVSTSGEGPPYAVGCEHVTEERESRGSLGRESNKMAAATATHLSKSCTGTAGPPSYDHFLRWLLAHEDEYSTPPGIVANAAALGGR